MLQSLVRGLCLTLACALLGGCSWCTSLGGCSGPANAMCGAACFGYRPTCWRAWPCECVPCPPPGVCPCVAAPEMPPAIPQPPAPAPAPAETLPPMQGVVQPPATYAPINETRAPSASRPGPDPSRRADVELRRLPAAAA